MKNICLGLLTAGFLAAGCWVALSDREGGQDRAARLPAAVAETFKKLFPGADLREVDDDGDGANRVFKLELRLAELRGDVELKLLADGSLIESEEQRELESAPELVRKSIARAFPKGRITEVRQITRTVITYELDLREGERRREVTLSPRGRILEVEKR